MYENMGQTIAKLRRDRNLTQEKLAEQLAVSAQAVSKWENATCYPDIDMLPRLAHFFGVSIDTLFGYTDTRTRQIDEVIDRIDTMNRQNSTKRHKESPQSLIFQYFASFIFLFKLLFAKLLCGVFRWF